MSRIFSFIIFFSLFISVFFALHFYAYFRFRYFFDLSLKWWYLLVVMLTISFPISNILERSIPCKFSNFLYVIAAIWFGILFLMVTVFALHHLLSVFIKLDYSKKIIGLILTSLVLILSIYSIVNAQIIRIKTIEMPLKNLNNSLKIVQLSDLHLGVINNARSLRNVVEKTNNLKPDIVMITGDLFDSSDSLATGTISILNDLEAKTFFTIGNHETYESIGKIEELLENTKIEILRNKVVEYAGIQIIGVDNPEGHSSRNATQKDIINAFNLDQNKPAILMYHQPVDFELAKKIGVNLQLSGHTHSGQIIPFNLIVKLFYPKVKGLYKFDENFSLYVSPGTGTWGPPMRLGSNSEITLFVLTSANKGS